MVIQQLLEFLVFVNLIHQYPNNQRPVFHLRENRDRNIKVFFFYLLVTLKYYCRIRVEECPQGHLNVYVKQH